MNEQEITRTSKFLSLILRHKPEIAGLTLSDGGWVSVADLLKGCAANNKPITRADLDEVVATNSKQRFAFDPTGTRIRANQGHSVEIDLDLPPAAPPALLYHGTSEKTVAAIRQEGLSKMSRHHVHLTADASLARAVGARHGKPVVLQVDAQAMQAAGHTFYISANGVWLVDTVPPEYLSPYNNNQRSA